MFVVDAATCFAVGFGFGIIFICLIIWLGIIWSNNRR